MIGDEYGNDLPSPDLVISTVADWEEGPEAAAEAHRKLVVP